LRSPSRQSPNTWGRGGAPPSQTWRTFLRNHTQAIAAIDLCVVPTLTFERLFAFLVLPFKPRAVEQQRRTQERRSISIPPHLRAEGTRWPRPAGDQRPTWPMPLQSFSGRKTTTLTLSNSERPPARRWRYLSPELRRRSPGISKNECLMGFLCRM
jgi:hypothetical protein